MLQLTGRSRLAKDKVVEVDPSKTVKIPTASPGLWTRRENF